MSSPPHVTLHVWHLPARRVPQALARVVADRVLLARGRPRPQFAKLLGTADGRTLTARDADLRTWALVATWASDGDREAFDAAHPTARGWRQLASEAGRIDLRPVSSRGRWSGQAPFGDRTSVCDGPVAALTRARLRATKIMAFWRAVPPVAASAHRSAGLRWSLGIGEAPVGFQGTFSVWDSATAMRSFSLGAEHLTVVRRTREVGWYAEELFATFAVVGASGCLSRVGAGA